MFAKAYKLASCFTQPIIISTRFFDKTVECGCGAFIVLNDEGWIITVAHLWESNNRVSDRFLKNKKRQAHHLTGRGREIAYGSPCDFFEPPPSKMIR